MEENKNKNKKKRYLPIIFIAILLVASSAVAGILMWNRNKPEEVVDEPKERIVTVHNLTAEEVAELEKEVETLTEEELAVLREAAANGVTDERTLRLLLLLDEELTIQVKENYEIVAKMPVNGKKTLTGDATIQTYLAAKVEGMSIFEVNKDAELTIDGLVLDANGVRHIVTVLKDATLNVKSGMMQYAGSYAINNGGITNISGGTIANATAGSIFVKAGSKVYITGGTSKDSYKNHIYVQKMGLVELTDYVMDGSLDMAVKNFGTFKMKGGVIKNTSTSSTTGLLTDGEAILDGVEVYNCGSAAWSNGGSLIVNDVYAHDMTNIFVTSKLGTMEVTNCKFEGTKNNGIQVYGGTAKLENIQLKDVGNNGINITDGTITMKDITLKTVGLHGILVQHPAQVKASDIELEEIKFYGWANCGAVTVLENVTATKCGAAAFLNRDDMKTDEPKVALLTMKNCTTSDSEHSVMVSDGSKVIAKNCLFNKMNVTNVYLKSGTLELSDSKVLGTNHEDRAAVSVSDTSSITLKNVEITGAPNGIRAYGSVDMQGGSIHNNTGKAIGAAMQIWPGAIAKFNLTDVEIYNNSSTTSVGGIYVGNKVVGTITNCMFQDNSCELKAGALYVDKDATVSVSNTEFKNNESFTEAGGALCANGNVIVKDCDFTENHAKKSGGAVYGAAQSLEITNCKFDKNQSGDQGGAIFVNTNKGTFVGTDCIFTNNEAANEAFSGGAIHFAGTGNLAKLVNSTKNEKGEYDFSKAYFKNNISAGGGGAILVNMDTEVEISGYKFDSNEAKLGGVAIYNAAGNVTDNGCVYVNHTSPTNTGAVRNYTSNGNGATFTKNGGRFEDNIAKTAGGAVTNDKESVFVMNGVSFKNNQANNGSAIWQKGEMTLTDVSFVEHKAVGKGTIYSEGQTTLNKCTFTDNTAVCGAGVININTGVLKDTESVYENNDTTTNTSGGAIRNEGQAFITGSVFKKNDTLDCGGAMYSNGSALELTDCTFEENTALKGGAIYINLTNINANNGEFKGTDCTFVNNSATDTGWTGGAAVFTGTGTARLESSVVAKAYFNQNVAAGGGGAILVNANATLHLKGYSFSANEAAGGGCAIYNNAGTIYDIDSVYENHTSPTNTGAVRNYTYNGDGAYFEKTGGSFQSNTAQTAGGAVTNDKDSIFIMTGGTFSGNNANNGSAVWQKGEATLTNVAFTGNTAINRGAIYSEGQTTLQVCNFTDNKAVCGAGVFNSETGVFTDTESVYENNDTTTNSSGGALRNEGSATLTGSVFKHNDTTDCGGAIYSNGKVMEMTDCTFEENTALKGGAIYINLSKIQQNNGEFKGTNCTFKGNSASSSDWAGGAVVFTGTGAAKLTTGSFENNVAEGTGEAIAVNTNASLTLSDYAFASNDRVYLVSDASKQAKVIVNGKVTGMNVVYSKDALGVMIGENFDKTSDITIWPYSNAIGVQVVGNAGISENLFKEAAVTIKAPKDQYGTEWTVDENGCLYADLPFATIGNTAYDSLDAAIAAAKEGESIVLWRNNTLTANVTIDKSITITNNGNVTIVDGRESESGALFNINSSKVLSIVGQNDTTITVDGADTSADPGKKLANVLAGGTLKLQNVCMQNVYSSEWGIAITNAGTLELLGGCVFENNSGAAGTIYNTGTLTDNGTIYRNNAARSNDGGAVLNDGIASFTGCTFSNNQTANRGGAVANRKYDSVARVAFANCTFTDNNAESSHGGAVWSETTEDIRMENCTFDGNSAKNGGAIYIYMSNSTFTGTNCIFTNNSVTSASAYGAGAAMFSGTGTATLTNTAVKDGVYDYTKAYFSNNKNNSTYKANYANSTHGGAITVYSAGTTLNLTGYKLENNTATAGGGGAIYVMGTLNDHSNVYIGNEGKTAAGGAIRINHSDLGKTCSFNNSQFYGNKSGSDGGAIYLSSKASITATGCIFGRIVGDVNEGNSSGTKGGAIYHNNPADGDWGSATYTNCTFAGNTATTSGAHLAVKDCALTDCTFENPGKDEGVIHSW